MHHEGLPPQADQTRAAMRREDLLYGILAPYEGLARPNDVLAAVIDRQGSTFGSKACPAAEQEADPDVPLDPDQPLPTTLTRRRCGSTLCLVRLLASPKRLRGIPGGTLRRGMDKPSERKEGTTTFKA